VFGFRFRVEVEGPNGVKFDVDNYPVKHHLFFYIRCKFLSDTDYVRVYYKVRMTNVRQSVQFSLHFFGMFKRTDGDTMRNRHYSGLGSIPPVQF
jgi:hypothetical protein